MDCGDDRGSGIPEHFIDADCGGVRQGSVLLRVDRIDLLVLSLSANTALRISAAVPVDFTEQLFAARIRATRARLVYTQGIVCWRFWREYFCFFWRSNGQIDSLYAVGAFWRSRFRRQDGAALVESAGPHWIKFALVNGFGAFVTGVTVVVVLVAKL